MGKSGQKWREQGQRREHARRNKFNKRFTSEREQREREREQRERQRERRVA